MVLKCLNFCVFVMLCVHGPEKGESVLVLMGCMCCLLCLYLLPLGSIIYDLGVWA